MVVVVIIAILATLVTLSVGNRALDDRLETEVARLQRVLQLAAEEAELKGIEIGVRITETTIHLLARDRDNQWNSYAETGPLRSRPIIEPFYLELFVEGRAIAPAQETGDEKTPIEPQLLLLSSGEVTAFGLNYRARGYTPYFRLDGDALGKFTLARKQAAP